MAAVRVPGSKCRGRLITLPRPLQRVCHALCDHPFVDVVRSLPLHRMSVAVLTRSARQVGVGSRSILNEHSSSRQRLRGHRVAGVWRMDLPAGCSLLARKRCLLYGFSVASCRSIKEGTDSSIVTGLIYEIRRLEQITEKHHGKHYGRRYRTTRHSTADGKHYGKLHT